MNRKKFHWVTRESVEKTSAVPNNSLLFIKYSWAKSYDFEIIVKDY